MDDTTTLFAAIDRLPDVGAAGLEDLFARIDRLPDPRDLLADAIDALPDAASERDALASIADAMRAGAERAERMADTREVLHRIWEIERDARTSAEARLAEAERRLAALPTPAAASAQPFELTFHRDGAGLLREVRYPQGALTFRVLRDGADTIRRITAMPLGSDKVRRPRKHAAAAISTPG